MPAVAKTSPIEFARQVRAETGKITWPTRKETVMTGVMVLIMATLLGIFFLGVDSFFDAVGFIGIGSMEYKRDPRDGRFYMVEPTVGRTDYQEEIACLNGVNIPLAAYYAETGRGDIPQPPRQVRPAAWRDPFGYARARAAGSPDPMDKVAPGIKVFDAYWRLDDPMPGVALKLASLSGRFSRLRKSSGGG